MQKFTQTNSAYAKKLRATLSPAERGVFQKLSTPHKVQDYLDSLGINFQSKGEGIFSTRVMLPKIQLQCMEGALFAAAALWVNGEDPFVLDLKAQGDIDHVIALYKRNGFWGAISKTNHSTLRFRDPVYKTIRELALSYFHEYFNDITGKKALRSYSMPFDLKKLGKEWLTCESDLHDVARAIDFSRHISIFPKKNAKFIRKADSMEKRAGKLIEWKKA